jgi:hypothetical protein
MPRTLSGLQTGEFDEIDVLHTVHINGNSGGAGQVLTSDGVNSDWNDIPSTLPTGSAGQVLTSNGSSAAGPSFNDIPSQLPTGQAGQVLTSNGSSDPSFNDMPSTNLPNLTIQRTAGDKTYNGTIAVDVPAPKHLTVAHNGTDLLTYDPSATNNQAVNIDCETLTINVGTLAVTYDTTSDNVVNVPVILPGNNISLAAPYANSQQVNVDIGASGLPTNGYDINMASGTYGQPGGDITNVRNILMDSYVGEIGSTTNTVNRIYATRIYVGQIGDSGTRNEAIYSNGVFATALYPEIIHPPVWTDGQNSGKLGAGGTRIGTTIPTSQPIGSNSAGILWNDGGTLKVST